MMVKMLLVCLIMAVFTGDAPCQSSTIKKGYPRFRLQLTDRSVFTWENLLPGKSTILIYFAPGCDHCRVFIKKLTGRINDFKHTQILLISHFPLAELQQFSQELKLFRFSNVKTGTEGNAFVVPAFFKIGTFPFTAVYDRTGMLSAVFRTEPTLQVLHKATMGN